MNSIHSASPLAGRTQEKFTQWVTVGGERQRVEYAREICWLAQSEARVVFRHGGRILREESTHNDFYGHLTSIDPQHLEVERYLKGYAIDNDSSLVLEVLASVFLQPVVETAEDAKHNAKAQERKVRRMWSTVPDDWRQESKHEDGETYWPTLKCKPLTTDEVVWTSKNSADQNLALQMAFVQRFSAVPSLQAL